MIPNGPGACPGAAQCPGQLNRDRGPAELEPSDGDPQFWVRRHDEYGS